MKPKQFARLRLGPARRITAGLTDHEHPSVSPDARLIAYYSGDYGAISIAVCGLDGRLARIVSPHGGNNTQPAWRPDGLAVAYRHQHDANSKWELWVTELAGEHTAPRQLLASSKWHYKHPSYSPDGKTLAYFSNEDGASNAYHIWLWDFASGSRRQVTFGNTQMHCHPVFSPDGQRIIYHAYEGTDEDAVPAVTNLYELDLSTSEVRKLTQGPDQYKHPFYLDDDVIVYHHERNSDGQRWLEAMHLGAAGVPAREGMADKNVRPTIKLTDGSNNDKHPFPFWRQGEPWLAFSSKKRGPELALEDKSYDIFIAKLATGKQKQDKGQGKQKK